MAQKFKFDSIAIDGTGKVIINLKELVQRSDQRDGDWTEEKPITMPLFEWQAISKSITDSVATLKAQVQSITI